MSEDIANVDVEITPEMIEAGEHVILGEVGGADLGGYFSARDLAVEVFLAMTRTAHHQSMRPARN